MRDASQQSGIGNFVAVQMEYSQDGAVAHWIKELIAMPTGSQRPRFRLAIANDACNDQVRVIKGGAIGMGKRVTEFAAFMNGGRRFRGDVAGDATRAGELLEEPLHAFFILG